jgi:hypothetical protein
MRWKYLGVVRGMIFLALFGLFWLLIPFQDNNISSTLLILLIIILILLILSCINVFNFATNIPKESEENTAIYKSVRKRTGKVFGIVFSIEFMLIGLAAGILFSNGLNDLFASVVAIIVGVHFFPLARLFKAGIYNITGAACILVGIVSFLSKTEPARQDFIGFSMGIIPWFTVAYIFIIVKREMANVKPNI